MRMMKVAGALALATVFTLPTAAQISVLPAGGGDSFQLPGAGRQVKTGTGRVKGRLVSGDTGNPVRRAQVRITGTEIMPKTVATDNEGRFEFRDLPAGSYTVNASKSGYVTVNYGQKRPFEPGKPIDLVDGQAVDNADITMPRGSVIAGRIMDEFGEPVADTTVTAMRSAWVNGKKRLQPAGRTATTNDLGQYRIYGLPPGDYFVSATLRGGVQEMMMVEAAMSIRTAVTASAAGASEAPAAGYAPTYYPGTPNGSEAQKLTLAVGQETQNTDFALMPVRLVKVSGSVITSDGRPGDGVIVSAAPRNASDGITSILGGGSARTDKNGHFTLAGIAPGDYTLNARASQVITSSGDGNRVSITMMRTVGGDGDGSQEFGSIPLSVSADDLSNIVIVTAKGATATGRVVWEGGSKPSSNPLRISAAALDQDGPLAMLGGSSSVTPDDTFEIKGLGGPRMFRVMNIPAGWVLKAVRHNGADITDTGVDIRSSEPIAGIEVVLTAKTTEVNGGAKAGSRPATDYTVVIFSDDPEKWRVPMSRHIRTARPNQQGRFMLKNLPAGSYYAVAVEYLAEGDWNDPDVLERLKGKATRFTLGEGDVKTLELDLESL